MPTSTGHRYKVLDPVFTQEESDDHCTCGADSSCEEDEPAERNTDFGTDSDEDDVLSATDATIKQFVKTYGGRRKMYIAVTADTCPPCKELKGPRQLDWHTATKAGTTTFQSRDAVALCFTVVFQKESFQSSLLASDGVKINGYPTILEYSVGSNTWKNSQTSELTSKKWFLM
jgi:hypothetical protein